jgi:hypothetical protein
MTNKSVLLILALAACFTLASCQDFNAPVSSASSTSTSTTSNRPTPETILKKFGAKNYTNTISYRILANESDTTSTVKYTSPSLVATYIPEGYEFDFGSGWDTGRSNFGYINLPSSNPASKEAGVYQYTLDSKKALVLGDKKGTGSDAYSQYYTPKYLYDNASSLGADFVATTRSEVNQLSVQEKVVAVAKALSVYGFLSELNSKITFQYVELNYSASSTSFMFNFYVDYDGKYAASGVYPLGARATLSALGTSKVAAITTYLGA